MSTSSDWSPNTQKHKIQEHQYWTGTTAHLASLQGLYYQKKDEENSSHLNHEVNLSVCVVLRGLPSLTGRVHRVAATTVP